MTNKVRFKIAAAVLLTVQLAACAKGTSGSAAADLGHDADGSVACASFQDDFWDGLHRFALDKKDFPEVDAMKAEFDKSMAEGRLKNISEPDRRRIVNALGELYELLALNSTQSLSVNSRDHDKVLETLTALELGDASTPEKEELQKKIAAKFAEVDSIAQAAGANNGCMAPAPEEPMSEPEANTLFSEWKRTRNAAVYGSLKAMATSMQSCSAASKPAITDSTPSIRGIAERGTHRDGIGKRRFISSVDSLIRSHFYLKGWRKPSSSCFNVGANPMIYDYGGKPHTTTATNATLNFFKNAGTGTTALGIDCSGFIYSALASAGLKVKSSGRLKAIGAHGISARMYMNPRKNGLNCLAEPSFRGSDSVRPGDIIATNGHIVMVATVGNDPFGISRISRESDCTARNIKVSNFNFTVIQSASYKNGMGINRVQASDYFPTDERFAKGMMTHAINACRAKTRGGSVATSSSTASMVRHKGTSECKDREVKLEHESCVASCPAG